MIDSIDRSIWALEKPKVAKRFICKKRLFFGGFCQKVVKTG
ncbi:hypothetical protein DESAMIL20_1164 [Desulfurella amilsii]|uniref:Uncharacterized protein n=1 Tax=Desulfurella amilsii TaxID=1562698 RepID=A0A1X4XVQ5_9BACT|nr:hypothetical protein DESAMIL20_1164 [Desulfurella amilsii]